MVTDFESVETGNSTVTPQSYVVKNIMNSRERNQTSLQYSQLYNNHCVENNKHSIHVYIKYICVVTK